ncbi:hypothetical protein HDV06_001957 [Boothiomyces sp. JEL0866]|nr:hypothetical protein HDV06_001957 [Boothiomyces sp. JEL0866]
MIASLLITAAAALPQATFPTTSAAFPSCKGPDCALGHLVADCMTSQGKQVDFAFVNTGAIRSNFTAGQQITDAAVQALIPFPDKVEYFQWTGQQILDELNFIAAPHVNATTGKKFFYKFPSVSGITFTWTNACTKLLTMELFQLALSNPTVGITLTQTVSQCLQASGSTITPDDSKRINFVPGV